MRNMTSHTRRMRQAKALGGPTHRRITLNFEASATLMLTTGLGNSHSPTIWVQSDTVAPWLHLKSHRTRSPTTYNLRLHALLHPP